MRQVLEEEKVHHLLTIGEYPLYVIPLDEDILSFELDRSNKVWKEVHSVVLCDIFNVLSLCLCMI